MKLVVFGAQWCGPCRLLKSQLKKHEIEHVLIDIDQEGDKARDSGVRGVPTLIFCEEINENGSPNMETVKRTLVGFDQTTVPTIKETLHA